jgi:hypothetical protein
MALSFLSYSSNLRVAQSRLGSEYQKYAPLYGVWLIDIVLHLGWHRPSSTRCWPDIFESEDFCAATGFDITSIEVPRRITAVYCSKLLTSLRAKLAKRKLPQSLTLFKNIQLLIPICNQGDTNI